MFVIISDQPLGGGVPDGGMGLPFHHYCAIFLCILVGHPMPPSRTGQCLACDLSTLLWFSGLSF